MNSGILADSASSQRDLVASRARSTRITADLEGDKLLGPRLAIVNPPLWELGHLAWFQERWCLRHRDDGTLADSLLRGADDLYDSARVAHETRWSLPLPTLAATRAYQAQVLDRVVCRLEREPENPALRYFAWLAACHEDMHTEAFHYTRQTLGYADPWPATGTLPGSGSTDGDVELAGGTFWLGARHDDGFVFDNEKW